MSENYEMIAAANLPTTDAKEVDVICVEGGELKRKTGSLGGGGYVVVVPFDELAEGQESGEITCSESYDNFANLLYNGGSVQIDMSAMTSAIFGQEGVLRIAPSMWVYVDGGIMITLQFMGTEMAFRFPNGTWTPPTTTATT